MNNAQAIDLQSRAADKLLDLAAQKQQLMREAALMVVSDAKAAAAHLAQLKAFEVRLPRAGRRERQRITVEMAKAQGRVAERARAHAANLVRMDALIEQAQQIEREIAALAPHDEAGTATTHGEHA